MGNTIQGTFGLDINPLRTAANRAIGVAQRMAGGMMRMLSGPVARIGASLAAIGGTMAFARGVKGAYDLGDALSDLSARTGESVKTLFILRQQLTDSGGDAEDLGKIINKLQNALGDKSGQKAIAGLGLRLSEVKRLAPAAQFVAIGQAIGKIGDPARRAQVAIDLFGKEGGKLLTLFTDPDFGSGNENLQKQAELLARNAATFGQISDRLNRVGNVLRGFFLGFAERASATLLPLLDRLEKIDLIGIGQKFADAMGTASKFFLGAFADPAALLTGFGEFLKGTLLAGLELFAQGLLTTAAKFNAVVTAGLTSALSTVMSKIPGLKTKAVSFDAAYKQAMNNSVAMKAAAGLDFGSAAAFERAKTAGNQVFAAGERVVTASMAQETPAPRGFGVKGLGEMGTNSSLRGGSLDGGFGKFVAAFTPGASALGSNTSLSTGGLRTASLAGVGVAGVAKPAAPEKASIATMATDIKDLLRITRDTWTKK